MAEIPDISRTQEDLNTGGIGGSLADNNRLCLQLEQVLETLGHNMFTETIVRTESAVKINEDFYGWLIDQAAALRQRREFSLDWDNLAEELESMGVREKRSIVSFLTTLLSHLLKLAHASSVALFLDQRGWQKTVRRTRRDLALALNDSPKLRAQIQELIAEAYPDARDEAREDSRIKKTFPADCPWSPQQLLDKEFLG